MSFSYLFDWHQLPASGLWSRVADLFCLAGALVAMVAMLRHGLLAMREREIFRPKILRLDWHVWLMGGALAAQLVSVVNRYYEVNHFPSQTMSEVLNMFCLALLASNFILHYSLGIHRRGPGWALFSDFLVGGVMAGVFYTHLHVEGLSTAQRDLPPALQSYWFAPHLVALIYSYGTMGIAALLCLIYFSSRYWSAAFTRGGGQGSAMLAAAAVAWALLLAGLRGALPVWATVLGPLAVGLLAVVLVPRILPDRSQDKAAARLQPVLFLGLMVIPFAQVVTLPVLVLVGLVFGVLKAIDLLPKAATLAGIEREMDLVSFRYFSVGMPFLTAGLFMGAFWAQEAWANYWGWDSKENSALITWLIYVVYIHLRMLGGYRGKRAMGVLVAGALSVFLTFQVFGYLPDSQKSLHRYTDDNVTPQEGQQGPAPVSDEQASANR